LSELNPQHINAGILRIMTVAHIIPMRNIDVNDRI